MKILDGFGSGQGLGQKIICRDGDKAHALGLFGTYHAPRAARFHRFGLSDQKCQALTTAHPEHNAELDFGLAKFRAIGGQDEIAHHGQFAAAAQSIARDRRDDGFAQGERLSAAVLPNFTA